MLRRNTTNRELRRHDRMRRAGGRLGLTADGAFTKTSARKVLVRIHAAGVNPHETYMRAGTYALKPPLPYTPGSDGAGQRNPTNRHHLVEAGPSGTSSVKLVPRGEVGSVSSPPSCFESALTTRMPSRLLIVKS
jgi:hypothetical protein